MRIAKSPKLSVKVLDRYIKSQELYVGAVKLSLALMKAYKRDPDNVVFIGIKLQKAVGMDKEGYEKYIYEVFDEIGDQAAFSGSVGISGNGLFSVIELVPKNKRVPIEKLIEHIDNSDFKNI